MSVSDIAWGEIVRALGPAGLLLLTGVIIYVGRPDRTAFGYKGTEIGFIIIAVALGAAILLGWRIKASREADS